MQSPTPDGADRGGMRDGAGDVAAAAARLEAAVERLASRLAQPRAPGSDTDPDMVPRAALVALSGRLDATLARLRIALADAEPEEEA